MVTSDPEVFADYLKSLYTGSLKITEFNCYYLYAIADFFQDSIYLDIIEKYVVENMNLSKAIRFIKFSTRFDRYIREFFEPYIIIEMSGDQLLKLSFQPLNEFVAILNLLASSITPKLLVDIVIDKATTMNLLFRNYNFITKINFQYVPVLYRSKLYNKLFNQLSRRQKDAIHEYLFSELDSDDYENNFDKSSQSSSNKNDRKIP